MISNTEPEIRYSKIEIGSLNRRNLRRQVLDHLNKGKELKSIKPWLFLTPLGTHNKGQNDSW